jgi:hypothetical protein
MATGGTISVASFLGSVAAAAIGEKPHHFGGIDSFRLKRKMKKLVRAMTGMLLPAGIQKNKGRKKEGWRHGNGSGSCGR